MGEIEARLLIGGEQVAGDGDPLAVENRFIEETVATVGAPTAAQLDAAIAASAEAQRGWERTPAVERGEMLHEVAARMRARTDELAELDRGLAAARPRPRFKQSGHRPRARPRGTRSLPGDKARAYRDRDRS